MTRHPTTHKTRVLPVAMAALAIACSTVQPTVAAAIERIAVSEIKPLLIRAAEQGVAYGVLGGTGAAYVQRRFDTTSPIEIDVRRLRALPQAGCGRLEVTTRQRAVLVAGQRQNQELVYQLSYCADGRFPEER
ncbi:MULTISPECIES: hypothetical protein [unclassified Acidovorax]|uniref:hypothetical protein n=1 Tax=unclassified Acidovorax TaxID=2684926 RepID=UPI000B406410|nr:MULTISPECIES: hypothetical protein [unclassified Acidovorax]